MMPATHPPDLEHLKASILVIDYLRGRALQSRRVGREEVFPCILHADGKRPNLRVNEEKNAWYCDVCDKGGGLIELVGYELFGDGFDNHNPYQLQQVREFLSGASIAPAPPAAPVRKAPKSTTKRPTRDVRTYDYTDADGTLLYQVVRREYTDEEGGKTFLQRRPDGKGGWHWNMQGVDPVLYHLSELRDSRKLLFGCEGEEDADEIRKHGFCATTNSGGAGKWTPAHSRQLAGLDLVQLPDNDPAGEAHAEDVARMSYGIANSVRIVRLPGLPPKGDVRDWFNAGGTIDELLRLIDATEPWFPTVERNVPQQSPVPMTVTSCEARLAAVEAELAAEKANVQELRERVRIAEAAAMDAAILRDHNDKLAESQSRASNALELIRAELSSPNKDPRDKLVGIATVFEAHERKKSEKYTDPALGVRVTREGVARKCGLSVDAVTDSWKLYTEAGHTWGRQNVTRLVKDNSRRGHHPETDVWLTMGDTLADDLRELVWVELPRRKGGPRTEKPKVYCAVCKSYHATRKQYTECQGCGNTWDDTSYDINERIAQQAEKARQTEQNFGERLIASHSTLVNKERLIASHQTDGESEPVISQKPIATQKDWLIPPPGEGIEEIDLWARMPGRLN